MASKTVIRSSQREHAVQLDASGKTAKRRQATTEGDVAAPVPASIRKASAPAAAPDAGSRKVRSPRATPAATAASTALAAPASKPPARSKARVGKAESTQTVQVPAASTPRTPAPARKRPAAKVTPPDTRPRLPAHVPADGLWEADSAIARRLQSLMERNAQLGEQLQRLQGKTPLKGHTP